VVDEGHEQLARPRDLLAMALRLLRDAGDLALGLLRARVQLRRERPPRPRVVAPVADELSLGDVPSVSRSAAAEISWDAACSSWADAASCWAMAARSWDWCWT